MTKPKLKKIFIIALFLLTTLYYIGKLSEIIKVEKGWDFLPYYYGSLTIRLKENPYNLKVLNEIKERTYNFTEDRAITHCLYPPFYMQILMPLTYIEPSLAVKLWAGLFNNIFILIIFLLIYLMLDKNKYHAMIFYSLFFLFFPLYFTLALGQVNILILTLLFASFYFYKQNKIILFSVFLSIAVLIKIFPVIIYVILFFRKKYKNLFISTVILIILFGISYLINANLYNIYITEILPELLKTGSYNNIYNISIWSFLSRWNTNYTNIITRFITIIITFIYIYKCIRTEDEEYLYGLAIWTALLNIKNLWEHHTIVLFLPFFIYYKNIILNKILNKKKYLSIIIISISFFIASIYIKYWDSRLLEFPLFILQFIKLYALLALYSIYLKF